MRRVQGLKDLLHDVVEKTTDLVQATHEGSAERWGRMLAAVPVVGDVTQAVVAAQKAVGSVVYGVIRRANHGARSLTDAALPLAADVVPDGAPRWLDRAESALNGLYGDFLASRNSGLAIAMALRHDRRDLAVRRADLAAALPAATGRVCLFVHGLGCSEREWFRLSQEQHGAPGVSFGTLLARDAGYTPLYLRYNSGLHISDNGKQLARLLTTLFAEYPRAIDELVLVGHSMGGLVARSAAHYGAEEGAAWIPRLRHVVCIASPHLGAPLARGTHTAAAVLRRLGTAATDVFGSILDARSAGIGDLRHGYVVDEDWLEDRRRETPFVPTVTYSFVAAAVTRDPEHPVGQVLGDLLVQPPSASGAKHIPFHVGRVFGGMRHLTLQNHPDVYAALCGWLN